MSHASGLRDGAAADTDGWCSVHPWTDRFVMWTVGGEMLRDVCTCKYITINSRADIECVCTVICGEANDGVLNEGRGACRRKEGDFGASGARAAP